MLRGMSETRIWALISAVIGVGFWAWSWYIPLFAGKNTLKLGGLGPAIILGGLALLLFPDDPDSVYAQACEKARVERARMSFKYFSLKHKVIACISIGAGIVMRNSSAFTSGNSRRVETPEAV